MTQHTIAFDTFQYAQDLKKAGFTDIQIETHVKYAKEQARNISEWIDDSLATKQDIKELERSIKELDLKIEAVRAELKKDIKIMGYKTIIGLSSIIVAGITVLGFLIQLGPV